MLVKLDHFPKSWDEHEQKYLSCHHLSKTIGVWGDFQDHHHQNHASIKWLGSKPQKLREIINLWGLGALDSCDPRKGKGLLRKGIPNP